MLFHKHISLFGYILGLTIGKDLWYVTDKFEFMNYTPIAIGVTTKDGLFAVRFIFLHAMITFGGAKFFDSRMET